MNGHRTPRRTSAGPHLLLWEQRPIWSIAFFVLVAALLFSLPMLAACGSDGTADSGSSTTGVVSGISIAPSTTSSTAVEPTTSSTAAEFAEGTFPVTATDDKGSNVTIAVKPMRIVSTAPSNTEILFALGVGDRVVGVTSLDDYPPEVADIAKVGDYQPNTEAVVALSPDLVVGYDGNEEALAPLEAAGTPVLIFDPATVEGIYADIETIGAVTGATGKAAALVESIRAQIAQIQEACAATEESPTVFYALDNTLWTCGPGSFVDELLALVNATNVGAATGADGQAAQPYYQFSPEQLVASDPDVILLPGSVYASADEFTADARFAGLTAVKEGRVLVIDDIAVTRPGPRIAEGLETLAEAVHPGVF